MHVRDVMTKSVVVIGADASVKDAAQKMKERNVGALPVVQNENILGLVTDRDIAVRSIAEGRDPNTTKVGEVMSTGFFWCYEEQNLKEVENIMRHNQVRRVVVLNHNDGISGIVSLGDVAVDSQDDEMTGQILKDISLN